MEMAENPRFYLCKRCGNMIGLLNEKSVPLVCCGVEMTHLVPNIVEASAEKHLPVIAASGNNISVKVGSEPHPMESGHHIVFVYVETTHGGQRKNLITGEPQTVFAFAGDRPVAVYAYCNLHGLWKTKLDG
jgi:superoxide reductase